ncbi:tetratricopeptide repeat protein [Mucilaginibacter sp. UYCu711]|uniref:tetratricopeptide repeat protein n=1 Tax=Mucilaginibacter sp. UYCu711 TaxID=3156339 RepID=UPI003D1A8B90
MRYIFKSASIIILLTAINSCSNGQGTHPKECIELNNKGSDILTSSTDGKRDLDKAVDFFKQSIVCDSTNITPYINLTTALDDKHLFKEEIIFYNKILKMTKNDPGMLEQKGMLFERMNDSVSANKIYSLAFSECKERLVQNPADGNLIGILVDLKAITIGTDEAIKELDKQLNVHPELSPRLSYLHEFYKNFNRYAFVHRLATIDGIPQQ